MKPGCFTQLHLHLVFAVQSREALLKKENRHRIFEYMAGILKEKGNKTNIINGVSDHVHLFFSFKPTIAISDIVHDLKRSSSLFINNEHLTDKKFNWQPGYGAFSCSHSQIDKLYKYIETQEQHHKDGSFREEYTALLKRCDIDFDEKFLFDFLDDM